MASLGFFLQCLLRACVLLVVLLNAASITRTQAAATGGQRSVSKGEADYWINRRAEFYANTSFPLTADNLQLMGGKFSSVRQAHLPFWFDYQLFKRTFKKPTAGSPEEELARHHLYINTCMRTIKARALFRMLAATQDALITSQADEFYHERHRLSVVSINGIGGDNDNGDKGKQVADDGVIDYVAQMSWDKSPAKTEGSAGDEWPLARAVRLMRLELDQVESRNQLETYLRAFQEVDGSAIAGRLPY